MRRRTFFGLFDAEGWPWAGAKAAFWFVVIIFLLGYIPDRAYYFTVERTIDLGILAWSPVNLCPPENEGLPCPVPAGAPLPWHPSPPELALPAGRTDGTVVQLGSRLLYIGGTNGATPQPDVYVAQTSGVGNFQPWQPGPPLPTALTDTSAAFLGGSVYVAGGADSSRKPTAAVYRLTPGADGALPAWAKVDALALPEPRAGAALVAAGDGLILVGGSGPNGPTKTVWKSKLDAKGNLGAWAVEPGQLFEANTGGVGAIVGEDVWLLGGQGPDGKPVRTVQIGRMGSTPVVAGGVSAAAGSAPAGAAALGGPAQQGAVGSGGAAATGSAGAGSSAGASGSTTGDAAAVNQWRVSEQTNLPEPRANGAGFTANGALYFIGGTDGAQPRSEMWWATPNASGAIDGWKHLAATDLPPQGLTGSAALASGSHAFLVGGQTKNGITPGSARTNLAPQEPFFQVGVLGATVPALKLEGEIGQQLGYLNAAGVGTVDFILLLIIGWAFAHKERTREVLGRFRRR